MMPSVRIMMATYNGEKFLRTQLDSLVNQDYEDWTLFVQDDGSTDSTWTILEEYAARDRRIIIQKSPERVHGAFINFHSISNQHRRMQAYDYYMYSDQDDIWDKDKISTLVSLAEAQQTGEPFLCFTDMRVIDGSGKQTADSVVQLQGGAYVNLPSLFLSHIIYGCSIIMNHAALMAVPEIDLEKPFVRTLSHDNIHGKYAGIFGKLIYYPVPVMSYRRHGNNVTAYYEYGYRFQRILRRLFGLKELSKDHTNVYNQTLVTIQMLKSDSRLTAENRHMLNDIEGIIRKGGFSALRTLARYRISWGNPIKDVSRRLVLLLGLYRQYLWQE